jgi:hypothetical protein
VESVPTPKKSWIQDGHVAQYPNALDTAGKVHGGDCTSCHGGVDGTAVKSDAHVGRLAIPGGSACQTCHAATVTLAAGSLHTTVGGYQPVLAPRGVDFAAASTSRTRFDKQCTSCHVANDTGQAACGHCHVSVPTTAGGGFLQGHKFQLTPSMDKNCTACHGSRVKDEYYAQNGALLARNLQYATAIPANSPLRGVTLQPDTHKTAGMDCADCHVATEMHGQGVSAGDDRYLVDGTPKCETCHPANAAFNAVGLHAIARHVQAMDCRICHAQPYKSCYGCHTDVTASNVAFFRINEADPTRAARQGTATTPPAGDAQLQFRAGKNPRFGEAGQKEYAVLRHVPIDADLFRYSGTNEVTGLVPSLTAKPTWKYATPHTIARVTPVQSSCGNCHSVEYGRFWLTDPVGDAFGWVGTDAAAQAAEAAANAGVVQPAPLPQ